ncbi:GNAT family N-acetyltransferase [Streptomyces cinnamoneus]|uniref:GNAT family N-acetyltransferase n=1 Tax=Streptomyces cinnamoneus TaxID=53446 RepID=A0A2G1XMW5_STRCJ|nr:GNAT family N-acetyltransferase [Streptomyces cinnamoneus]PHQ52592.1 GNAT family N-acetyltransferase [Streptomyces cinnamoneus]PPT16129.1 N-acetyltransferase [Streptomyces cinnamoneus]
MIITRPARPGDASEIVRLRRLMFAAMSGEDSPGDWERTAEEIARRQLADTSRPGLCGFVVDGDPAAGGPHLAACSLGRIEERLPAPGHPTGRFGFVFTVCTDPRYRGRGFARATTEALLELFAARGVTRVDLHATEEAEALYRSLGFAEHSTALSLDVSRWAGTVSPG